MWEKIDTVWILVIMTAWTLLTAVVCYHLV